MENLENIGLDCPCYDFGDCSEPTFDIGDFFPIGANNGKLTITVNGEVVGEFYADQSEDTTIDVDLSNYATQSDLEDTKEELEQAIADKVSSSELDAEATLREEEDTRLSGEIEQLGTELNEEVNARTQADTALQNQINTKAEISALTTETTNRENSDIALQSQIDAITSKSDIVDIVGTKAELDSYDTSDLGDKDIVKVLTDNTHDNAPSYYRWNKTAGTWSYVGSESVAYTKAEADDRFVPKTRTINNKALSANVTLTTSDLTNDSGYLTESDLTEYVKRTDYSTATTAGVVKTGYSSSVDNNGVLRADSKTLAQYNGMGNNNFVGKGTLENVLNGRKYLMPEYTQELPATGEENKLYLTPATEQPDIEASASGKEVELTNASEGDLIDWTIKGDTEQNGEPTPDTPQEVKTVTGRNTVKLVGKNVWVYSSDKFYQSNHGDYLINQDGSLTIDTPTSSTYANVAFRLDLPDGTYTFSLGNVVHSNPSMPYKRMSLSYYVGSTRTIIKHIDAGTPQTLTLENTSDRTYVLEFWTTWATGLINNATFYNVQVERGSTATTYQPYHKQEVELNFGKNLFDKDNAEIVHLYNGANNSAYNEQAWSIIIPVEPNTTYTYSNANSSAMKSDSGIGFYSAKPDVAGVPIIEEIKIGQNESFTFTTRNGSRYILLYYRWTVTDNPAAYSDIQLERGSKATSYAEYFEPIELCKLGDYQDRIFKEGGEWKIEKKTGKFIFTDNTTPTTGLSKNGVSGFVINANNNPLQNKHIPLVGFCSHFAVDGTTSTWTGLNKIGFNSVGALWFQTGDTNQPDNRTVEQFFDWVKTEKITIYYALANPTTLTITNQALIDQLNELETLTTAKGYNLATTDTPTIQPFLEFTYFRPDPTVTKDEWLWIENHYELLGGERRYTHNLSVNHHTAQGHWNYAFTVVGKDASHYTQLAQVAYYLFKEHAGLTIPVSGTYTEGNDIYMLTKISANSLSQVTIEMRKLSDGSPRTITTGAVPVLDTIS